MDRAKKKSRLFLSEVIKRHVKTKEDRRSLTEGLLEAEVAIQLAKIRERLGMTQSALAKAAALKQQNISRIEKGGHSITLETLARIAGAMNRRVEVQLVPKRA